MIVAVFLVISTIIVIAYASSRRSPQERLKQIQNRVMAPGRQLADRFESLGDMTGKTIAQIEAIAGPANSISAMANGRELRQWQRSGFHIAIQFKNGVIEKITHQYMA